MISKLSGKKPRLRLRTLALFVSVVFTVTNVLWPAPMTLGADATGAVPQPLSKLAIPAEMGTISKVFLSQRELGGRMEEGKQKRLAPSGKFVVLIQDAHAVSDAQENIRKILGWLSKEYGVRLVALEGARGRIEPILFRTFPDAVVKRKVLAGYEKRGELSGPEMAAVLQDQEGDLRGMESWDLYERNYAAYLAAKQNQGELLLQWNKVKQECDTERVAVYGVKLNEFQMVWEDFRSDRAPLLDLLLYLSNFSAQLKKSSGYEELPGLIRTIGYEKSGRPGALVPMVREIADQFKARYLRGLGVKVEMNFYNKYQAFMTGEIPAGQMLQYLVQVGNECGKTVKLTPALKKLLGHTQVLSEIKGSRLAEELGRFLFEVEASLIKTPEERTLAEKYHRLFLVKDLINLELSFKDLAAYEKDSEAHQALFKDTSFVKSLEPALAFYRSAIERDRAFYKHIESMMDEQGRANRAARRADRENRDPQRFTLNAIAVVAGGFHTSGIESLLQDKGVPYAVVTPKINSLDGQENYARVMQGDVSYKDYLKTTYFDALMRHASRLLSEALPLPDRSRMLKLWRDDLIRQLAREGRITEAGKYLRYIDAVLEAYAGPMSEADSQTLREKMIGIVRTQLGQFKSDMLSRIWKTFEVQLGTWTDGIKQLIAKKELNDASAADLLDRVSRAKPSFLAQLKPMDPAIGIPPLSDKESMMREPRILQPSGVQVSTEAEPQVALRSESRQEDPPEALEDPGKIAREKKSDISMSRRNFLVVGLFLPLLSSRVQRFSEDFAQQSQRIGAVFSSPGYDILLEPLGNDLWRSTQSSGRSYEYRLHEAENSEEIANSSYLWNGLLSLYESINPAANDSDGAHMRRLIDQTSAKIVVLLDGQRVAGFYRWKDGTLDMLAVAEKYRGTGAVDILLEDFKDRFLGGNSERAFRFDIVRDSLRAQKGIATGTINDFRERAGIQSRVQIDWSRYDSSRSESRVQTVARTIALATLVGIVSFVTRAEAGNTSVPISREQIVTVQKALGVEQAGVIGPKTIAALQKRGNFQFKNGKFDPQTRAMFYWVLREAQAPKVAAAMTKKTAVSPEMKASFKPAPASAVSAPVAESGVVDANVAETPATPEMSEQQMEELVGALSFLGLITTPIEEADVRNNKTVRDIKIQILQRELDAPETRKYDDATRSAFSKLKAARIASEKASSLQSDQASKVPMSIIVAKEGVDPVAADHPELQALNVKPRVVSYFQKIYRGYGRYGFKLWPGEQKSVVTLWMATQMMKEGEVSPELKKLREDLARDNARRNLGQMRFGTANIEGGRTLAANQAGGPAASTEMLEPRSAIDAVFAAASSKDPNVRSVLYDNLSTEQASFIKSIVKNRANNNKNQSIMSRLLQNTDFQDRLIVLYFHHRYLRDGLSLPPANDLELQAGTYHQTWAPGIFEYPRTLGIFLYADTLYNVLEKLSRKERLTESDKKALRQADTFSKTVESVAIDMRQAHKAARKGDWGGASMRMNEAEQKYAKLLSAMDQFSLLADRFMIAWTLRADLDQRNKRLRGKTLPQSRFGLPVLADLKSRGNFGIPLAISSLARSESRQAGFSRRSFLLGMGALALGSVTALSGLAAAESGARNRNSLAMISTGESLRANPYSTKVSEDLAGVFYGGEIRSGLLQAGQCCFILVHPKGRNTPLGAAHFFPGNVLADEWASPEEIKDQVRNIKAQFIQAGIGNDSVFYMFQNGPSRKSFSKILQLELSKDYESGGSYDLRGVFGVQVDAFRDQEVWKIKVPTASGDMRLGEGQIGVDGRFQFERMDGELSEESPYAPLWFAGIASLGGMLFYLGRVWKRTGTFSPKGAWRMMREDFSRGQGSVSKREDLTESETRKRSETREEDEDADSEGEEASKEWEGPPGVKIEGYNYHYYPTGGFQFLWHGFTSRVMADLKKKMDDLGIEREEGLERLLASGETLDRLRAVGDSRQLWRIYLNPVDQDDFEIAREIVRSVAQRFSAKCIDLKYLAENFFTKKLEIDSSRVSPLVINFLDRADLEAFYAALRADPRYAKIQGAGPTLLSSPLLKEDGTVDPLACMVEGGAGQGYAEDRLRELFKKESPEAFVRGVSLARGGDLDRVLKVIRNLWEDERGSAEQGQPNLRGKAEKVMVLLLRMKTKVTLEAGAKKIEGDLPEKLPLSLKLSGLDVFADMDVAPDGKDFLITIRQGQDPDSNPSVIRLPIGTASKIIVGRKDVPVGASGASADWRLKISRQQLEIGIDRDGAITLKHLSEVSRTSFVQDSERSEDDAGNRAKRSEARAGRDGVEDLSPDALGRVNRAFEDYMDVIKSIQAIPNYATRLAVDDAFRTAMEELMIPAYDALATALFDLGILGGEGLRILYPFMGTDLVLALRGKTRHINWHARDIELGKGSLARTLKDFKASDKAIANLEIDPKTELDATDPRNYEFLKEKGRPPYVLVLKGFAFYGGRIADREDTLKIILSYLQPQDRVLVLTKSDAEILERMRIPVLDQLELYEGGSIAALEGGPHEQRKVLLMPDRLAVLRKDGKGSLVSVPLAGALALEALRLIADERSVRGDDISIMAEKYGFGQYSQDQQTLVAMVKLIGQTNPTHNNLRQTLFWLSGGEEVTPAELASRILRHEVIFNEDESYRCFEPRSESRLGSQSLKDILQKYIPKGTDVRYLDLDTGLGNFLPEFDDSLDALGYKVKMGLGTESDPSVRGKSKEVLLSRIVPYDVLEGDLVGTDVDFAEHSFDIVTINNVVTRYRGVPEATRLAEQAKRLLKRDQSVLLVTVEESDAEAGLDKQVAVDIEKAGFEVTVQDMPEDYPSYEGFTAKKLIIARPRISGGGFGQGAIMSLSAVNDALRRILEAHKGTVENEGVAQEAAGYQFILSSWNISGRRIEDLEETDLLLLEQMKAFIQKYEGITLPKLPPEPAVVGEDAPLPVGLLKQLLEQMATTAVKTEAPEKMRSEMRALGETELKKLEGEFDKGIKNVLGPVLAAKTPAAIRSYVEDDAFEAAMLKEFEPRLNPFFGDESAKRVKAVVESIRQTFAEIDVAGVGLGIRGFVDAGPSGLRKDEIVVATAVLDVMDAITGKTQESPIIVVINHSDSDNDRVLKILELLTLNRLILLHRKDQRVGRGFNLPSVPLTTVVYDQENPQKTADKQVGNLKVDGTVVALMTDDLRIGKVGVYTIIAEIGRISDPDLKALACAAIRHVLLKYSSATETERELMKTNPALILTDLKIKGFEAVIRFNGNVMTFDVQKLADLFSAKQSIEQAA